MAIATIYSLFAFFVVIIYLRLYFISRESGVKFRIFVEFVHPVMQVMMLLSVMNIGGLIGGTIAFVGVIGFSVATFPFLFNILFRLGKENGRNVQLLSWFDLGESVVDSLIHAILCFGMAVMFLPHEAQPQWLVDWLTMFYVGFFIYYLLKLIEQDLRHMYIHERKFKAPSWPETMKIVAHLIMVGSMIHMNLVVHALPSLHIH